jgi:hypothetical protein
VAALAIEPLTMALTVTGRKAYDVMLWLAQRGSPGPEGGYSSPVSAILKGYGSTTKASERVQRYIEQMVQTTVVWRPLAASEQTTLVFDGSAPGTNAPEITDEARTFPLLAEARLYMRNGQAWVTWFYPPSIREQLISPERWAQIELNSITRLNTYTAVALYEICARYKDSPGGLTSRQTPEFWSKVLREGGGTKAREYRKFKHELLMPAVAEINEKTEILVDLVEHRLHGTLDQVQFKVKRQIRPAQDERPEAADVTLPLRAAKFGIREADLDTMVGKYGALKVTEALDAMDAHVSGGSSSGKISNAAAYLKTVLANRFPDAAGEQDLSPSERNFAARPVADGRQLVQAFKAEKMRRVHQEFAALPPDEQELWIERASEKLKAVNTPGIRKRLLERDWESPLIRATVLDVYASQMHGSKWAEPSDIDLALFAGAVERPARV